MTNLIAESTASPLLELLHFDPEGSLLHVELVEVPGLFQLGQFLTFVLPAHRQLSPQCPSPHTPRRRPGRRACQTRAERHHIVEVPLGLTNRFTNRTFKLLISQVHQIDPTEVALRPEITRSGKQDLMAWDMESNLNTSCVLARTTALCSSLMPMHCSRIQPLASSGKSTPVFRAQRSKHSRARAHHWCSDSPLRALRMNTSWMCSPISSLRSFSGHLVQHRANRILSLTLIFSFLQVLHHFKGLALKQRPYEGASGLRLQLVHDRMLLTAHCFHRRYSR